MHTIVQAGMECQAGKQEHKQSPAARLPMRQQHVFAFGGLMRGQQKSVCVAAARLFWQLRLSLSYL